MDDRAAAPGTAIALSALVPEIIRGCLERNSHRLDRDFAEQMSAIVLFADVSGFSTLGADLVSRDSRGAEQLRTIINAVFEAVLAEIEKHGGSVVRFAGDAVIAVWPLDYDDQRVAAALSALACGFGIHRACESLGKFGEHTVSMRSAVVEGEIWMAHLGANTHHPEVIVGGQALQGLGGSELRAPIGQVFVTKPVWLDVESKCTGREVAGGVQVMALRETPVADVTVHRTAMTVDPTRYLAPTTSSLVNAASSSWLAEFRQASVLFVQFPSFDVADFNAWPRLATLVTGAKAAIAEQGGTVLQFMIDDKGLVLLAAWGLALNSFEDDAERALLAAAAINRIGLNEQFPANAAVSMGKVFAGLLGNTNHLEYAIVGEPINRAAAMMQQAAGETVCDLATRQAASQRYEYVEHARVQLKGHAAPITIYRPIHEARALPSFTGTLIGRQREQERLAQILGQATNTPHAPLIHLEGEAGLGKSRLSAHFENQLSAHGHTVIRVNADSLRRTTAYYPWQTVFAKLLSLDTDSNAAETVAQLDSIFTGNAELRELIPLAGAALPVALPDNDATRQLSGLGRADRTNRLLTALLSQQLQVAKTFIIVEDAHWFDSASWQLLELVHRRLTQIGILIVSRPLNRDQLPPETIRLLNESSVELVSLRPLSREEVSALACDDLALNELEPRLLDLIFDKAEGHPLYTKAFVQTLMQQGVIQTTEGHGRLHLGEVGLDSMSFPDGIEGIVAEQVASLEPAAQLTLKVASVLGRSFDLPVLQALHPIEEARANLPAQLDALCATGLVELADPAQQQFRFHHALIADTVYKLLVSEQRQSLHRVAAQHYERLTGQEREQSTALLAYHYEQADDHQKSIEFLDLASEQARLSYSNLEVIDFVTRALAIEQRTTALVTPDKVAHWKLRMAEALRALGYYRRAETFLTDSAAALDKRPPSTKLATMGGLLSGYAMLRTRPHRDLHPSPTRDRLLTAAAANTMLSEIHYEINKIPQALTEVLRGTNLARRAGGDSETLAKLYIGLAVVSTAIPWALDGDWYQREAVAMSERLDDPTTASWVLMVSGTYDFGKGAWASSEDFLRRAMTAADACAELKNHETAMSMLGNLKRLHGWFEEANQWSQRTLDASLDRGVIQQQIWSYNGRARDLVYLSRLDEAKEVLSALGALLHDPAKRQDSNDNNELVYLCGSAVIAAHEGHDEEATKLLDRLFPIVGRIDRPQIYMIQNTSYYCDALWTLLTRSPNDAKLLEYSALTAKNAGRMAKLYRAAGPRATLALGDQAYFTGEHSKALTHWQASIENAKELDMVFDEAHARNRIERVGLEKDSPAIDTDKNWRALIAQLNIAEPVVWQG